MSASDGENEIQGLKAEFLAEASEHLQSMQRILLAADGQSDLHLEQGDIDELFRRFHTLKGMSAMMELDGAERLCHQAETYLRDLKGHARLSGRGLDELLSSVQLVDEIVTAFRFGDAPPSVDTAIVALAGLVLDDELSSTERLRPPAEEPQGQLWMVTYRPTSELAQRGISINEVRSRLSAIATIRSATPKALGGGAVTFEFVVAASRRDFGQLIDGWSNDGLTATRVDLGSTPSGPLAAPQHPTSADTVSDGSRTRGQLVRVDLARLDELMRTVGELVVSRARLEAQLRAVENRLPVHDRRALGETTQLLSRQLRTLREGVMRVRLVPVREVFERMRLVARDAVRTSRQQVTLLLEGADTEIDKFLIDRIMGPLLHIVRNAIGHGLEPAEHREARGKPTAGTIRLEARTQGDTVIITVADDGRGIDAERVQARARQLGLMPGDDFDSRNLLNLLCLPGLSTREVADRVSGRGVGLSAARAAIEDLGGSLQLDTTPGQGTRFTITLPLTLAITDALLVRVDASRFAVPQALVREVIEMPESAVTRSARSEIVLHRGRAIPLVRLQRLFGLEPRDQRILRLLLVGEGRSAVGVVVDRILGLQEVVVHTIRDPLIAMPGIAGATELGDGDAVLILDVADLAQMAHAGERQSPVH